MSDEAKRLAFVAFCIESYKAARKLDGAEVASLFVCLGVDRYLYDEYDILHTMGEHALVDDIGRFIEVRGGAA